MALAGLYGAERRIELIWLVAEPKLPKDAVKLLLNLAMLAGDALVRGGQLTVGEAPNTVGTEETRHRETCLWGCVTSASRTARPCGPS